MAPRGAASAHACPLETPSPSAPLTDPPLKGICRLRSADRVWARKEPTRAGAVGRAEAAQRWQRSPGRAPGPPTASRSPSIRSCHHPFPAPQEQLEPRGATLPRRQRCRRTRAEVTAGDRQMENPRSSRTGARRERAERCLSADGDRRGIPPSWPARTDPGAPAPAWTRPHLGTEPPRRSGF